MVAVEAFNSAEDPPSSIDSERDHSQGDKTQELTKANWRRDLTMVAVQAFNPAESPPDPVDSKRYQTKENESKEVDESDLWAVFVNEGAVS